MGEDEDAERGLVSSGASDSGDNSGNDAGRASPASAKRKSPKQRTRVVLLGAVLAVVIGAVAAWWLWPDEHDAGEVKQPTKKGDKFGPVDGQAFDLKAHLGVEYPVVVQDIYEDGWARPPASDNEPKYLSLNGIPGCSLPAEMISTPAETTGSQVMSLRDYPDTVTLVSQIVPGAETIPAEHCGRQLALWPTGNFAAKKLFTIRGGCNPHDPNAEPPYSQFVEPNCVTDQANVVRISRDMRHLLESAATTGSALKRTSTEFGNPNQDSLDSDGRRHRWQYEGLSFAVY